MGAPPWHGRSGAPHLVRCGWVLGLAARLFCGKSHYHDARRPKPPCVPVLNGRKCTMCRGAKMGFERDDRAVEIALRQGIDNPEVLVNGIE
jgi:hypothetical protein